MAYQETPEEKQKRQAKEADWAAKGKAAEAKQYYEVVGSRGDAARKGMEEGRMDPMGNPTGMKAGGHVHHSEHYKKHAAGHKVHQEHVKAMCGGGMAYGKKAK